MFMAKSERIGNTSEDSTQKKKHMFFLDKSGDLTSQSLAISSSSFLRLPQDFEFGPSAWIFGVLTPSFIYFVTVT